MSTYKSIWIYSWANFYKHTAFGFNDSDIYIKSKNIERIVDIGYFGRVHAIALDSINRRWIGAADKDWEGSVSNFE